MVGGRRTGGRQSRSARDSPGWSGQGEIWTARFRWWENRPHVGMAFSAPRGRLWPGVWTVSGAWDRQSYAALGTGIDRGTVREDRATAGSGCRTGNALAALSHRARGGPLANRGRFVSTAAGLDWRWFADRLSATLTSRTGRRRIRQPAVLDADLRASLRTSTRTEGFVGVGSVSMTRARRSAPLPSGLGGRRRGSRRSSARPSAARRRGGDWCDVRPSTRSNDR
jgi:hypothetical protein